MAATSAVMLINTRVVSLAASDCSPFVRGVAAARLSLPFALTRTGASSRGGGVTRCTLETDKKEATTPRKVVEGDGWIAENDGLVRSLPLFLGAGALLAVLLNRSLSGIAPVADSSSAQSRSDVLALALAATVLLQGLVWKSIQPRPVVSVEMDGVDCFNMAPGLPDDAARELKWVWDALRNATRTKAMVVLYGGDCVLQAGIAEIYLANLVLYPGRFELSFLPSNTQAVLLQPLGDDGVLVLASDSIRGFTPADQAWVGTIAEKVDTTLQDWVASSTAKVEGQAPL